MTDKVNHPSHYNAHPSGVECWKIIQTVPKELADPIKYLWRKDLKNGVEDALKALWYLSECDDFRAFQVVKNQQVYMSNLHHMDIVLPHEADERLHGWNAQTPLGAALLLLRAAITGDGDEYSEALRKAVQITHEYVVRRRAVEARTPADS